MKKHTPAIIFDFDGTIGDSLKIIIEIADDLTHKNIKASHIELDRLRTMTLSQVADELKVRKYQWPILLFKGRKLMNKRIAEIKPFLGIEDVLKKLKERQLGIYIISSNSQKNINTFLRQNGLRSYFDAVHGGVSLFGKSRALKKLLKKNKLDRTKAIYVGDEPRDIEASRAVKLDCISVTWGFNDHRVLSKYNPQYIVNKPSELTEAINFWLRVIKD